jgi:hypothetical protein
MPTDPPPAAPSQLAIALAQIACADIRADDIRAHEVISVAMALDAKLAPVREALNLAQQQLNHTYKTELSRVALTRIREALASLSPQPPEAKP